MEGREREGKGTRGLKKMRLITNVPLMRDYKSCFNLKLRVSLSFESKK